MRLGSKHRRGGFTRQALELAGTYWKGAPWRALVLTAGLVILTVGSIGISIRLNMWNADLFNALEQKAMPQFLHQIALFFSILVASVMISALHLQFKRRIQLEWRDWMTRRLLGEWMAEGRHFQIKHMPGEHDNPDGRIAEDIKNTTEGAIELATSFLYCVLLLVSFVEILWTLSGPLELPLTDDLSLTIPGHMVWLAFIYSAGGSVCAVMLGRPLVRATDNRQTAEANFRVGLVRARENSEAIALLHGEEDERRRFRVLFDGIKAAWQSQTGGMTRLFIFTSAYSVLAGAVPVMVTAPRYILGAITLGVLMQTAQAFQQLSASLSWPVDNFQRIAEWRASAERVLVLLNALKDLQEDLTHVDDQTISIQQTNGQSLTFRDLAIADPDGEVVLSGFNAEIAPGERVLIAGDPDAAIKLFKVIAGLWRWGSGRVEQPCAECIFFMPQRPYLPHEKLRDAVVYPKVPGSFSEEQIRTAIEQTGAPHLLGHLDDVESWGKTLTSGDQQRLGFARLLLHRPDWIFIQEATDALDPASEEQMMGLIRDQFPTATVLTLGYHTQLEAHHQRKLVLERTTDGSMLVKETVLRREAERARHLARHGWWSSFGKRMTGERRG